MFFIAPLRSCDRLELREVNRSQHRAIPSLLTGEVQKLILELHDGTCRLIYHSKCHHECTESSNSSPPSCSPSLSQYGASPFGPRFPFQQFYLRVRLVSILKSVSFQEESAVEHDFAFLSVVAAPWKTRREPKNKTPRTNTPIASRHT